MTSGARDEAYGLLQGIEQQFPKMTADQAIAFAAATALVAIADAIRNLSLEAVR